MKICYVAVDVAIPHVRGASTHVYEVAKHLARLGHEVHVVSRRVSLAQLAFEFSDGFHVHRIFRGIMAPLPLSSYLRLEREIAKPTSLLGRLYERYLFTIYSFYAGLMVSRIVKKHDVDIILERETSFGAGAIASMITSRPMVLEVIGPRYSRFSFQRSRKILAYTRSMIRGSAPFGKLVFVTAAVDVDSFKPNPVERKLIRERYGLQDSVVVGYVGTFARWHGIEELIDASVKVTEQFSNVRFLMVGPYFRYASKLVQERGASNAFLFTGPILYRDIPKYMNATDILVAPYNPAKSELRRRYGIGSPLKVFEYMACGKPVITTSVEPIIEVIQNRKTGILVPPGDSEALSMTIIHLIKERQFAESIGKAARKEVEKHYSWKTFAINLERVLKEVVKAA